MRQTQNPYGDARTANRMFLILCIVMLLVLVAVTCNRLHAQTTKRIRDYTSCSALSSNDYVLIDSFTPTISCKATTAQLGVFLTVGTYAPIDAKYIIAGTNSTLTADIDLATVILRGPIGSRPAASIAGRLYFATDVGSEHVSRDTGSAWIDIILVPVVHDSTYHTGQIFPTADTGQKINGGYIDFSSASLAGNPTTGVRRQEVDPSTGELSIKNSIGNFISLENHVPLPVSEGGSGLTTATDDTVLVGNGSARQEKTLPNCMDSTGQHINYTASTNAFTCGTSGSTNSFATITPTSGSSPVASSATDTLNIAAGSGITITGNSGTKTITVAVVNPLNQNTSGSAASLSATNDVPHGGTGATSLAVHGVVLGNGTSPVTVTGPGVAGQAFVSNGTGVDPSYQAVVNSLTGTVNQIAVSASTGGVTVSIPSSPTLPGTTTGTFSGNLTGNVTGNASGSAGNLIDRLKAHSSSPAGRASTATLALDSNLVQTVTAGLWLLQVLFRVQSNNIPGFQMDLGGTAVFTVSSVSGLVADAGGTLAFSPTNSSVAFTGSLGGLSESDPIDYSVHMKAVLNVTTGGTVGVTWAQAVSNASTTNLMGGAILLLEKW